MPTFVDKLVDQLRGGSSLKEARRTANKKRGSTKAVHVKVKHSVKERRARSRINQLNR